MQDFPFSSHANVNCILTTLGCVGPFLLSDRLKRIDITIIIDVSSVYLQGQTHVQPQIEAGYKTIRGNTGNAQFPERLKVILLPNLSS